MLRRWPLPPCCALAVAALAVTACGDASGPEAPVATSIVLSPGVIHFPSLATDVQVSATVRDQSGDVMSAAAVSWASSDAAVATVSSTGLVASVAEGAATITASSGAASAEAAVTVVQVADGLTFEPSQLNLVGPSGDTATALVTVLDPGGTAVPAPDVTWRSADQLVATVDDTGLVTAQSLGETWVVVSGTAGGVTATDSVPVGVWSPLSIVTSELADAVEGMAYEASVVAEGGNGSYTWSVTESDPPQGVTLEPGSGVLSGTPTLTGEAAFTVSVISGDGQAASAPFVIQVHPVLEILTEVLPGGSLGNEYGGAIGVVATGGSSPYTFEVIEGSLPDGIVLDASSGELSGVPTTTGLFDFTVRVRSADGQEVTRAFSVEITASLRITTTALPDGLEGDAYSNPIEVEAPPGVTVTLAVVAGSLPAGLGIPPGTFSVEGTPTTPGTSTFTVEATGSDGQSDSRELSITIVAAPPSPSEQRIVFTTFRDAGDAEIYIMAPNGSNPTNLTSTVGNDLSPSPSPDGTKIAFASARDGNFEIYVMDVDGSNPTRLTNNGATDLHPRWSPDGTRIAFYSTRDGNSEIYVMNADGSNQVNLTNHADHDQELDWSPDGTRIAYTSDRSGNRDIWVMNADGSNPVNLTNDPGADFGPTWAPTGGRIAFSSDRDGDWDVWTMSGDNGLGLENVTSNAVTEDYGPDWSADGSEIVFVTNRDGDYEIYRIESSGGMEVRVTSVAGLDEAPRWVR